jgi:hypothetical protein
LNRANQIYNAKDIAILNWNTSLCIILKLSRGLSQNVISSTPPSSSSHYGKEGEGRGKAGRRGGEVAASHNTGRALGCRGGKRGQRGAAAGERERREERERGVVWGKQKQRNSMDNNGGGLTGEDKVYRSREENRRLATNQRLDRRIEGTRMKLSTRQMQRYPRMPDTAADTRIESNCTPELSPDLEPPRTLASNFENCGSNMGNCFKIWKVLDERVPSIYILLGFEDILFFVIIPFLELKIILEKAKIVLNVRKYIKGSKNSRNNPRHDLAPNELKTHI